MGLTAAQKVTLGQNIDANAATIGGVAISALPHTADNAVAVAAWYNLTAAGPFVVWRDLTVATVSGLVTMASMTPLDAIPAVTSLPSNPTAAQNATYNNQMALLHIWGYRNALCTTKQVALQNLTIGRDVAPMKLTGYRAALQDCLTNVPAGASGATLSANWVGVRDAAKFNATNAEKVFATGTGTFATPADLAFEGSVTGAEVGEIWGI
jgi:hypothetical protein